MAYDPNAPNVNNAYQLDVEQIRENLNQLRIHETVVSASDIDSLPNLQPGMIVYVSSEKAFYGIFTDINGNPYKVKLLTENGALADKLDGYDAGNSSGQIPISNGTLNTNLNADMVDGYHVGTATNQIPLGQNVVHDPVDNGLIIGDSIWGYTFNSFTDVNKVISAGGGSYTYYFGRTYIIIPANKKLYLRRIRYLIAQSYNITSSYIITLSIGSYNIDLTSSPSSDDKIINYLERDNSNNSNDIFHQINITLKVDNYDATNDLSHNLFSGSSIWFQCYII